MVVLVIHKNKEGSVILKALEWSHIIIDFSDAQRQLTPKSVMKSCGKSNLSKLICLALLPARMKK